MERTNQRAAFGNQDKADKVKNSKYQAREEIKHEAKEEILDEV